MLNRSQTLKRLIEIGKIIDDNHIKREIELLVKDLIGNLNNDHDELIDKILLKAFTGEVTTEMAMVAIHEVVLTSRNIERPEKGIRKRDLVSRGYR